MRATVWLNEDYNTYTAEDGQVFPSMLDRTSTETYARTFTHTHAHLSLIHI